MALSVFDDKERPPREEDLRATLGKSFAAWSRLKSSIASQHPPIAEEWGFTSRSTGWGLRLKRKDRIILYMTPCEGYFLVSFALGEKAVKAAHDAGLSEETRAAIDGARKYAEGRGVRFEVRTNAELRDIEKIAAAKAAN